MSNAGHFNNKQAQQEKDKKPRFFEDFKTKELRLDDGTPVTVKGGKVVHRGTIRESKHVAKVDVSSEQSKFYKPTTISTLVEKTLQGEKETSKETMGEAETRLHVRKPIDVNRRNPRP
jgi:hypothetical protein